MPPLSDADCASDGNLPAAVRFINATVLGLGPAVAGVQGYLGLSLASQIGLFETANHYQQQAMSAAATAAAGVLALRSKPPAAAPPPAAPSPAAAMTPAQQVAAAHQEAESAAHAAGQSVAEAHQ